METVKNRLMYFSPTSLQGKCHLILYQLLVAPTLHLVYVHFKVYSL